MGFGHEKPGIAVRWRHHSVAKLERYIRARCQPEQESIPTPTPTPTSYSYSYSSPRPLRESFSVRPYRSFDVVQYGFRTGCGNHRARRRREIAALLAKLSVGPGALSPQPVS